jgi:hypothetical protein
MHTSSSAWQCSHDTSPRMPKATGNLGRYRFARLGRKRVRDQLVNNYWSTATQQRESRFQQPCSFEQVSRKDSSPFPSECSRRYFSVRNLIDTRVASVFTPSGTYYFCVQKLCVSFRYQVRTRINTIRRSACHRL